MKSIYCISGLGADERAFARLKLDNCKLVVLPWIVPEKDEDIAHYAARMRVNIAEPEPILLGLSFGGMVCVEIAKQIPVSKIIIVSSIRTASELPHWMKTVAFLRLNKLVPLGYSRITEPIQNIMLGVSNDEEKKIARDYRKRADKKYVSWAVEQAINWKNTWRHPHLYQIHGDHDKMFPIQHLHPTYIIQDAGHFMIMNRAPEVSQCINDILRST